MTKLLGGKVYGSIPHLPTSRAGEGEHFCEPGMARICTVKARDGDRIVVQEKLDGSCCAVAKVDGNILAFGRAGHLAQSSKHEQHQLFANWVRRNEDRFDTALREGERIVGEWMAQAHGIRYRLPHEPFVIFDIITGTVEGSGKLLRMAAGDVRNRVQAVGFKTPQTVHVGGAIAIDAAYALVDLAEHGASGAYGAEGLIYRVERPEGVDFVVKWVNPAANAGCLLPDVTGEPAIWNWRP